MSGLPCAHRKHEQHGRGFSAEELKLHRDRWFKTVADNPEILIRAAQATQTQTGPLEALFAELSFNQIAVGGASDQSFPPLATDQFKRAIATNALASLDDSARYDILQTYKLIGVINDFFLQLAHVDRTGGHGSAWVSASKQQREFRLEATDVIPRTMRELAQALGWHDMRVYDVVE